MNRARPAALVAFFLILALVVIEAPSAQRAEAAALLDAPNVNACTASNATVSFRWQPTQASSVQWLDLSYRDNGFAPGTFGAHGPLTPTATSHTWEGLQPGLTYFWRVNSLTPAGWITSATGSFVPCGGSTLLPGSITCEADGSATVRFRWSVSTNSTQVQWLDMSVFDNGFQSGTFVSAGPMHPSANEVIWPGISANTAHVFRINALTASGWQSTQIGSFIACPEWSSEAYAPPLLHAGVEVMAERWILVDLDRQEVTAMIGDRPLYTAFVTTGKPGWETPRGNFSIVYRVQDETMTSASIGAEEYYVLEDVLYTQYFTTEGHALHLNYWRPDYYFGEIASSHGCVGIRLAAVEFLWRFATYGTRVTII